MMNASCVFGQTTTKVNVDVGSSQKLWTSGELATEVGRCVLYGSAGVMTDD